MRNVNNNRADEVRGTIRTNAAFGAAYVVMNVLAAVIASHGLLLNSTAVVIGAMIIALLLGPIVGIALALVDADIRLLRQALMAEVGGIAIVFGVSFLIGRLYPDVPIRGAILSRTAPNIMDLVIALAGGAAGAYASISPRVSVSVVGVAIATALVPPLCVCGITLARGETALAGGSFILFLTNLVAIQLASSAVLALAGYHGITRLIGCDRRVLIWFHGPSAVLLIGLAILLGINFNRSLAESRLEKSVRQTLADGIKERPGSYLTDLRIEQNDDMTIVVAVVRTPFSIEPKQIAAIQAELSAVRPPVELHIRSVLTKEATARGWLHQDTVAPSRSEIGADGGD